MMAEPPPKFKECMQALSRHGLLMLQDARLPSVTTIVVGAPVKGSWWGHARGHAIFNASQRLEEHADVAVAKLVDGKVTYIHRRLWPALVATGSERALWQTAGLTPPTRALFTAVKKRGSLRTDLAPGILKIPARLARRTALELEKRLLIASEEVHTQTGAHAKQLEDWPVWAARRGVDASETSGADARGAFERALAAMNEEAAAAGRLPWQAPVRTKR